MILVPALAALALSACRDGADAARQRDFARAEPLLRACVGSPHSTLESFLLLCGVYQAAGNQDALFATAQAGIQRFPSDVRFYLTAAAIAGRRKQYEQSIELLERALKQWPKDEKIAALLASAYVGEGTARLDAGDSRTAVKHLRRATELAPGDAEAFLNLGRALHNLERYKDAIAAFDRAGSNVPLVPFHRGLALFSLGEFAKSISEMDAQIAADANYGPAYLIRGMARLAKGEAEAAAADLERAAAQMTDNAAAQLAYGRALIQLDRLSEAEAPLRKAVSLDPGDPAAANTLVSVLMRLGRVEEGRALSRTAADLARQKRNSAP
jgi:tetratricopeptide (TPR) repeat protein